MDLTALCELQGSCKHCEDLGTGQNIPPRISNLRCVDRVDPHTSLHYNLVVGKGSTNTNSKVSAIVQHLVIRSNCCAFSHGDKITQKSLDDICELY